VVLWDWEARQRAGALPATPPGQGVPEVSALAYAQGSKALVSGGGTKELHCWDLESAKALFSVPGHRDRITAVAADPQGRVVASADRSGRILVWDVASGAQRHRWDLPGRVHGLAFAPDGRHLATANHNGTVYVLRLAGPER
jgi:WD40 repeat protein